VTAKLNNTIDIKSHHNTGNISLALLKNNREHFSLVLYISTQHMTSLNNQRYKIYMYQLASDLISSIPLVPEYGYSGIVKAEAIP